MIIINSLIDILLLRYGLFDSAANIRFIRGLTFFPLIIWLFKGLFFQKVFAFFMQLTLISILNIIIGTIAVLFIPLGEYWFFLLLIITALIILSLYLFLIWRFGRRLLEHLFSYGSKKEWALYSISAIVTLFILTAAGQAACDNDSKYF